MPKAFSVIPAYLTVDSSPSTIHHPLTHRNTPPMLIILASLWSSFLDERVQVQTFAKLGPVFLACKNSDAAILLSPYLQLQGPLFLSGCLMTHKHSSLPPPASPPMSPALCQAEARLTTMWISIPRTRCAELCPVVPNHQQCAFCYTHTPTHHHTTGRNMLL